MSARYAWRGGEEMLLRHGEGAALTLLVLPALFEEANRMRRFTVELMRRLGALGLGTILPDLPGMGESLVALADVALDDWRDAARAVADTLPRPVLTVAMRGGALLDGVGDHGWRLAPESGERLLRDLVRATALASAEPASVIDRRARAAPTMLAGDLLSPALYTALLAATPPTGEFRVARPAGDAGAADVAFAGTRLWRTAEPAEDSALADSAAADIAAWAKTCAKF